MGSRHSPARRHPGFRGLHHSVIITKGDPATCSRAASAPRHPRAPPSSGLRLEPSPSLPHVRRTRAGSTNTPASGHTSTGRREAPALHPPLWLVGRRGNTTPEGLPSPVTPTLPQGSSACASSEYVCVCLSVRLSLRPISERSGPPGSFTGTPPVLT